MSISDDMRFEKWLEEWDGKPENCNDDMERYLEFAYEAGFYNGVEAARNYDPRWDGD